VLLRQALKDAGKIAVAKVVIKTRQHLAAIKAQESGLMLELMHFPEEILAATDFKAPAVKTTSKAELAMAKQLVASMSAKWDPEMFHDDYHELLKKVVDEKIHEGGKAAPKSKKSKPASKIIDLVSVLQKSIADAQGKSKSKPKLARKAA
jgi:DNA end-binding protein Ku